MLYKNENGVETSEFQYISMLESIRTLLRNKTIRTQVLEESVPVPFFCTRGGDVGGGE